MTDPALEPEEPTVPETSEEASHTPNIAQKVSRFGPANLQNGSKFGK